jgi:hypothetical protein|tara:strand:+ start:557 stop:859 length:303 start_codon:yes stop_codon:yes gene_type:complete
MKTRIYKRGDPGFENALDVLEKKYFHNGGGEEAETIVNWNKREVKEEGTVCLFASNSTIASAIKRCRSGIERIEVLTSGVNMHFNAKYVRPMHMILKVKK